MTVSATNTLKISQKCNSASSTIKDKNYDIESLCYKAQEIIRSLKSEKTNRSDLIDEFKDSGIASDLIQANEVLRWLEEYHEIFLVEDSGLVNVTTYRNISNFDRHQRQLQEQWLLLLHTKEFGPSCAIEEAREIAVAAIVREEEQEQQTKEKKKKPRPKKQAQQQIQEVYFSQ